ncbi:MAG: acetate--CoA ligase family protein [Vicinamibacterales bacterium]|nr:acetate--CoA ligase family protein [Vicinamibacterales bacterium]
MIAAVDPHPSEDTLTPLLHPSTVAIIGASDNPTRIGGRPQRYMRDAGFGGRIYPVNPHRETVQGLTAFASIADLPEPIDMAIIAVPAPAVVETTEACAAAHVKTAVIFSAGFAETGDDGGRHQAALAAVADATPMRIVGPNCLGVYNSALGFFGTFTSTIEAGRPKPGRVGLVSQSGAYGSHLSLLATRRGIGIRFWVTTGNECDVDVAETIGWLVRHPDISVIVAYAEGVRDRNRLFASLTLARERGKPVIFQKVGRTEVGADAVRSHTASLAGSDAVYDGVFRQFGVYRARDTEEMLDVAYAATFGTFPASRRVGLMSISGGVGVQMADEAVECGLEVTPMSDAAQARLKALLPFASPRNPVDITAQAFNDLSLITANLDVMLEEGTYDAIVAFFTFVAAAKAMVDPISETLRAAKQRHPDCLLVLSIVGPSEIIRRYEDVGCPVFEDPARAVRVVDALARFSEAFARQTPPMGPVPSALLALPAPPIGEHEAKQILAEAGLPMVEERLCATADEAVAAAGALGFPVALKIASPNILHKTETGGVELDLGTADTVSRAFAAVTGRARLGAPDARIDGVLVSRMVTGGVETILGVQHDPTFGPVVMFGLGGIFVETLKDVSFRVAPFEDDEAHRMMRELTGFPLLEGVRGHQRCDLGAVAAALSALSRFAAAHTGHLESAELNPVVVFEEGHGLLALDALLVPSKS